MKTLIIGGGAAGASCAARLRRNDEHASICIIEQSDEISIANCGLPYYIGQFIENEETLKVSSVEQFKTWFDIDVLLNTKVTSIHRKEKYVETSSKEKIAYDNLVIATGAKPFVPNFKGLNPSKTFTLRKLSDANGIKNYIKDNSVKDAIVIGAGFIGVEISENLANCNIHTTLIEKSNHIMANVDEEVAQVAQNELTDHGIDLILNDGVQEFKDTQVILESGKELKYDLAIVCIGVRPDIEIATNCGLQTNRGICVNESLVTSDDSIYAAGDNIEVVDFTTNQSAIIPLAGPANRQGRIIADNICNLKQEYKNTLGSSVVKIFDLTLASVGTTEKRLRDLKIPYLKTFIYSNSHASYYPNATQTLYKLLFNADKKILGAQAIGLDGVEKRIDVISTVMRLNGNLQDLIDSELCYAPPYSSAKDAINVLGMNALNILNGYLKPAFIEDLDSSVLIDVRPEIIYKTHTIEGAINVPITQLRATLSDIPKDKKVVLFCNTGYTSYNASRILIQNNFSNVYSLCGGIKFYDIFHHQKPATSKSTDTDTSKQIKDVDATLTINACGLQCPGPIMQISKAMDKLNDGQTCSIQASDSGFYNDIQSWCKTTKNTLLNISKEANIIKATIKKTEGSAITTEGSSSKNGQSIVVFSDALDKAMASLIIANGAAAANKKVTMFFTFWGLNLIKKENVHVPKKGIEKIFSMMMPSSAKKLPLSKFNFGGLGRLFMNKIIRDKQVSTVEDLLAQAKANGVKFIACSMSMDIMGITKEELIDGVEIGGVASYINAADESNSNLFI